MTMTAAQPGRFGAAFDCLGVERAWTRTRGSPEVVIAIVDEGVQVDHPLLGPNIQRDLAHHAVSADAYEIPGTHAAGVAAGRHSDVESFSGVAPACRILPVRFAARAGAPALDLTHAIEYAVEMGACVINLAHAADITPPAVQRAIQYAATRNALVVCSAGAHAGNLPREDDLPNIIRVAPVDPQFRPLTHDARHTGATAHLAAPAFARVPHWRGSGHSLLQGPAIAAPYVTGCAALIKALNPGWGYHELKEHLLVSATRQPHLADHCLNGQVLHVANAVVGPIEHAEGTQPLIWPSLNDTTVRWTLHYRSALCVNVVALYRPQGDEHWRELAFARAGTLKMSVPAAALRRSSGVLRLACRESNFHADDIELTIR